MEQTESGGGEAERRMLNEKEIKKRGEKKNCGRRKAFRPTLVCIQIRYNVAMIITEQPTISGPVVKVLTTLINFNIPKFV